VYPDDIVVIVRNITILKHVLLALEVRQKIGIKNQCKGN
jgi:hypothetical protein